MDTSTQQQLSEKIDFLLEKSAKRLALEDFFYNNELKKVSHELEKAKDEIVCQQARNDSINKMCNEESISHIKTKWELTTKTLDFQDQIKELNNQIETLKNEIEKQKNIGLSFEEQLTIVDAQNIKSTKMQLIVQGYLSSIVKFRNVSFQCIKKLVGSSTKIELNEIENRIIKKCVQLARDLTKELFDLTFNECKDSLSDADIIIIYNLQEKKLQEEENCIYCVYLSGGANSLIGYKKFKNEIYGIKK